MFMYDNKFVVCSRLLPFPADCGFFVWKNQQQICLHCFKWREIFRRKINFVVHLLPCINSFVVRKNLPMAAFELKLPAGRSGFLQLWHGQVMELSINLDQTAVDL